MIIIDGLVEQHYAELIHMQMRGVSWEYNYSSVVGKPNKHWHRFCGHDVDEVGNNGLSTKGIDKGTYPVSSQYRIGVQLDF